MFVILDRVEPLAPVRIRLPTKPRIRTGIHRLGSGDAAKGEMERVHRERTLAANAD